MFQKIKSFLFENSSTRQTVAKNAFWLTISNFGGRLIKSGLILYAARVLGTDGYGVFSYAVSLAGFLSLFMDPGVNSVLMRDIAKSSGDERKVVFSSTLALKLLLVVFGVGFIIFAGPYFSTLPGAVALLPVVACIVMFDTLREFILSLLRGLEKMEWDAAIYLFTNVAIVAFGFTLMGLQPTAQYLGWGYALGTGIGALAAIVVVRDHMRGVFANVSRRLMLNITQAAWPFAVTGALGLLLTNTDILIISWMGTASDVGIYSAAIRIIQILYLVPAVVQMSTLPLLSRLVGQTEKFRDTLERTVGIVFLLSIPMAVGGILLGTEIMSLLFGPAFATGSPSFKILMVSLLVDYPGSIIANAVFAYAHQKSLIATSAVGGITNVVLDLILIPHFGITGSAVATLIAQIVSNAYLWHVMRKINYFSITTYIKKVLIASGVMGVGIFAMQSLGVNVVINIIFSTFVYFGLLVLMKDALIKEIKNIFTSRLTA